ncbi:MULTISPECIES: TIGR02530 family flagellar biosynthesis protein [Thalassobacillus]|uniref:TIGR02530 family flagellar biosynthesis protein n=1 Tax=Thalassobacillus TaxID=331971 RepID=UPI000A1CBD2D|nr:TIGR02530 family flagellar biosynthesis protein [Thalassobacillus devorans]
MEPRIHQLHQPMPLPKVNKQQTSDTGSISFKDVLADATQVKLSKHAGERLQQRNIVISQAQWDRLSEKMQEAKKKGITDSLVLLPEAALLVSTKNNTVITAMNRNEASSKIFSNINGTILMDE